jgi:hypothetical protein
MAGYQKPSPIGWTIDWADGTPENSASSHTYNKKLASGTKVVASINDIAGFDAGTCDDNIAVKVNSTQDTDNISPH